jgi:AraC-like DNA-binding protein
MLSLPRIHAIGRSIFDPIWAEEEHTDFCSELIYVLRGQVTVKTSTYSITAQEGDVIYTAANTPHRDIFPSGSVFEVYLIQFLWDGEEALLKKTTPHQMAKAARNHHLQLAEDFTCLFRDFIAHRKFSQTLVQLRLLEIIYRMAQEEVDHEESSSTIRRHQIMQQAREIILQNFNRQISLDSIAEKLDISPYYLSRIFSEESGFTLCHYLTQVRLEKAVEWLNDSRRTISEIAYKTGFKDSHYFSRVFKAWFGCSPKEYRLRENP